MRARSQWPQRSLTGDPFSSCGLEAQPLSRSDSTNATATAKQKAPHQLNSLMASPHLPCSKRQATNKTPASSIRSEGRARELVQKPSLAMPILWRTAGQGWRVLGA